MQKILFEGNTKVYLQGQGALSRYGKLSRKLTRFHVANQKTRIVVRDYRPKPVEAVYQIVANGDQQIKFSEQFNLPAWVKIRKNSHGISIEMHDEQKNDGVLSTELGTDALLWLGVIRDGTMPVHRITWHVFKPISESGTAFVALVQN